MPTDNAVAQRFAMESARRHGEMNAAAPDCCAVPEAANSRAGKVVQALRLEYLTVIWNLVEGVVAVAAAIVAGSVALMGFGIDSFVDAQQDVRSLLLAPRPVGCYCFLKAALHIMKDALRGRLRGQRSANKESGKWPTRSTTSRICS